MQIHGASQLQRSQPIAAPHMNRASQVGSTSSPAAIVDQLDISEAGQIAGGLGDVAGIRQERVQALREAIANGDYESDEKLGIAVDRLLDAIG